MKTWWINIFTFLGMLARIFIFLFRNNRPLSVYCLGIYENQWIHLIPYRIKTYTIVLDRIILTSSPNSSEKTQKLFWDNVARMIQRSDDSKQKQTTALHQGWKWALEIRKIQCHIAFVKLKLSFIRSRKCIS